MYLVGWIPCNNGEQVPTAVDPNALDIGNIEWVKTKTPFSAILLDESENIVTSASDLKPNTSYILRLKSDEPMNFKIQFADGFKVTKGDFSKISQNHTVDYHIKTVDELGEQLYVNIIPLLKKDDVKFVKESPSNFLLPNIE